MGFPTPTFNLHCNVWRAPHTVASPPDFVYQCNLAYGRRVSPNAVFCDFTSGASAGVQELLLPPRTDIIGAYIIPAQLAGDGVEVPVGSGRFYVVVDVVDVGYGFSNEYRLARLWQANWEVQAQTGNPWNFPDWPVPTP